MSKPGAVGMKGAGRMTEFKEGQTVWFYYNPGDIRHDTIKVVDDGFYFLSYGKPYRWWDSKDLYASLEEAKAALSPDGKRMAGCLEEARRIRNCDFCEFSEILQIAFKLFDAGGE